MILQTQLEKHVNGHFSSDQPNGSKRSSDPPAPKKVKKDQKKTTKIRRQPWSGKCLQNSSLEIHPEMPKFSTWDFFSIETIPLNWSNKLHDWTWVSHLKIAKHTREFFEWMKFHWSFTWERGDGQWIIFFAHSSHRKSMQTSLN